MTLIGWAAHESRRFVVYEFLPGGDVSQKLSKKTNKEGEVDNKNEFGWIERFFVALEVTQAIAFLHGKRFWRDCRTHRRVILFQLRLICVHPFCDATFSSVFFFMAIFV